MRLFFSLFCQVVVEYTKLSIDSIQIKIPAIEANKDSLNSLKELQDIISAVRLTSSLLLTLIINEDEDNLVTMNNAGSHFRFSIETNRSRLRTSFEFFRNLPVVIRNDSVVQSSRSTILRIFIHRVS